MWVGGCGGVGVGVGVWGVSVGVGGGMFGYVCTYFYFGLAQLGDS